MNTPNSKITFCPWLQAIKKTSLALFLSGLIALAWPATGQEKSESKKVVTVRLMNGQKIKGRIVYADSAGLVFWKGMRKFSPENLLRNSKWIALESIDELYIGEPGSQMESTMKELGTGLFLANALLGSATNGSTIGFNYVTGGRSSDNVVVDCSSTRTIQNSSSDRNIEISLGGNRKEFLRALDLLKQYELMSSPSTNWNQSSGIGMLLTGCPRIH